MSVEEQKARQRRNQAAYRARHPERVQAQYALRKEGRRKARGEPIEVEGFKQCQRCTKWKFAAEFDKSTARRDGIDPWCKQCKAEYQADRHCREPDRVRDSRLIERYDMAPGDYDAMLDRQGGLCAICRGPNRQIDRRTGLPRRMHVDHNHETGAVRGLLCHFCNVALGFIEADPRRLLGLLNYLEAQ